MQTKRGISLVTILVVLAILVVVAAFAIPAWHDRVARGHIEEDMKAADAPKLVVMEAASTKGGLAHVTRSDLAYNAGPPGEYVDKLELAVRPGDAYFFNGLLVHAVRSSAQPGERRSTISLLMGFKDPLTVIHWT